MCASCSAPGVLSMPRAFAVSEWIHSCKVKYLIRLYVVPTGFPIGRLHISFFGTSTGRKTSVPPFSCGERGGTLVFRHHDHVIYNGCASYQQIKIIIGRSTSHAQPRLFKSIQVNSIAYRKDFQTSLQALPMPWRICRRRTSAHGCIPTP